MTLSLSKQLAELAVRTSRAALSRIPVPETGLRAALTPMVSMPPGQPGSFLADPVLEGSYPWQPADVTMGDLSGTLLHPALITALDRPQDPAMPHSRRPYRHQVEAWRTVLEDRTRSLIVASGTGSGKTECFMVPMLDSLVREHARHPQLLVGVQALVLYPLNALIASQRKRLAAWTRPFGGDIRFCLYNGMTPEVVAARNAPGPEEVGDRQSLRDKPPPVLVTNITMLEYMMIRPKDRPILEKSQGKLRWIILDEVHSFRGTPATELTLLLRRVMRAFDVKPDDVQVIATSATIGDLSQKDDRDLLEGFLADLGGIQRERVRLVTGQREVPVWPAPSQDALPAPDDPQWDQLAERAPDWFRSLAPLHRVRERLVTPGYLRLREATELLFGPDTGDKAPHRARALDLIDAAAHQPADPQAGEAKLLPYRLHLFHRAQPGLWSCIDPACPHKQSPPWPFGQVFLNERERCPCGGLVLPLKKCSACGTIVLEAEEDRETSQLRARNEDLNDDVDLFDIEPEDDDEGVTRDRPCRETHLLALIGRPDVKKGPRAVKTTDGDWKVGADLGGGPLVSVDCPNCGTRHDAKTPLIPFVLGAPFIMNTLVPNLMELIAPPDFPTQERRPFEGRRLLTFTDSRQGTARLSLRLQRETERNWVRGVLYHTLQETLWAGNPKRSKIQASIDALASAADDPAVADHIRGLREQLAALPLFRPIAFEDLQQRLSQTIEVKDWLCPIWKLIINDLAAEDLAKLFLIREWNQRPRYGNTLETLGLSALELHIPAVKPPAAFNDAGGNTKDWIDLIHMAVTFLVRNRKALAIKESLFEHSGALGQQGKLLKPGVVGDAKSGSHAWPAADQRWRSRRLMRLVADGLGLHPDEPKDRDRLDEIFRTLWTQLLPLFVRIPPDLWQMKLEGLHLAPVTQAWLCPVTSRVLDRTFRGFSPYTPGPHDDRPLAATPITMPQLPQQLVFGPRDEIRDWLEHDPAVQELRDRGIWTNLHDRIATHAPLIRHVEHTAQICRRTLEQYEQQFEAGKINVLNCSTTMEMGIDIAGVTAVMMANVPPYPANYRQRVGRAGRRQDPRSIALTFCRNEPLGWEVFNSPTWAFDQTTAPPQVRLNSPIIARRHVHALMLSRFLAAQGGGDDVTQMTAGSFFEEPAATTATPPRSPSDWFVDWYSGALDAKRERDILKDLAEVLRGTPVAVGPDLLPEGAAAMAALTESWRAEQKALQRDQKRTKLDTPPWRGLEARLRAMRAEYLITTLCHRGFLPGHGFPTRVVALDTTNRTSKAAMRPPRDPETEESPHSPQPDRPSRDLYIGLREYAPDSEVVVNGRVYVSGGVARNWIAPPDSQAARSVGALRVHWQCTKCRYASTGWSKPETCPGCGADRGSIRDRNYLEPSGFAVDFHDSVKSDVQDLRKARFQDPIVSAGAAEWIALPAPDLGRMRVSTEGRVFVYTAGLYGHGYDICLECGRASSSGQRGAAGRPPTDHRHLVTGRPCGGNESPFAIRPDHLLGFDLRTEVCEVQLLWDALQVEQPDRKGVATTLAVALREALCRHLGVDPEDVGFAVEPEIHDPGGKPAASLYLWDTEDGGLGFASRLSDTLETVLALVEKVLDCPKGCDSACSACLLRQDSHWKADDLDRHSARDVIAQFVLPRFTLSDRFRIPGRTCQAELRPLAEAVMATVLDTRPETVYLILGDPANHDAWPLRDVAERVGRSHDVHLVTSREALARMDAQAGLSLMRQLGRWNARLLAHRQSWPKDVTYLAMLDFGDLRPMTVWGQRTQQAPAPLIRASADGSDLPAFIHALDAVDLQSLVRLPPDLVEVRMGQDLVGPVTAFGSGFWKAIFAQASQLEAMIANAATIQVSYRDRYLGNPIACALFVQTIRALGPKVRDIDMQLGRPREPSSRRPMSWQDDWTQEGDRATALRAALEMTPGTRAKVAIVAPRDLPHSRSLRLTLDTLSVQLRLDQGFGAWSVAGHVSFGFTETADQQGRDLVEAAGVRIRFREPEPSPIYVDLRQDCQP